MTSPLSAEVERVRAVALEDAARLLTEPPDIAYLTGAALAAQVGADLIAAGWPMQHVRIVADTYRNAIALELEDLRQTQRSETETRT